MKKHAQSTNNVLYHQLTTHSPLAEGAGSRNSAGHLPHGAVITFGCMRQSFPLCVRFEPRNDRMSQCSLRVWADSYLALNGELNLSSKVTSGHNLSTSVSKFDCSTQEQSRAQHGVANYINSIFV